MKGMWNVWLSKCCHNVSLHSYEAKGKGRKTIPAQKLWFAIMEAQIETGTPYMLYKDACNRKSNQQNIGTIRCSNLCTEIVEFSSPDEVAVCNLASIAVNQFVDESGEKPKYDFEKLKNVTKVATRNLNKIIDINFYPVKEVRMRGFREYSKFFSLRPNVRISVTDPSESACKAWQTLSCLCATLSNRMRRRN